VSHAPYTKLSHYQILREVCRQHEVTIMKGHISKDHMHLFVSVPPQATINRVVQWLKRISSAEESRWRNFRNGQFPWMQDCCPAFPVSRCYLSNTGSPPFFPPFL
jgi:REP element-mobilizing transposase RayT